MTLIFSFISFAILISSSIAQLDKQFQSKAYLLFSFYLIIICLFKPFGVGQDDLNYVEIVRLGCTSFTCEDTLSITRDFIWFFFVSFAPLGSEFIIIKFIASTALSLKLYLIYKMTENKLFGLSIYVFAFYSLHDLTQYRAGLSSAFFILALFAASRYHRLSSVLSIVAAIGAHIQAATIAAIFATPKTLRFKFTVLPFGALILSLIFLDLSPSLDNILFILSYALGYQYDPSSDIGKYIYLAESTGYNFGKISFISIIILLSLYILKCNEKTFIADTLKNTINGLSWASVFLAYALYFIFSSVIDMQNRFYEFLIIPIVFLFGNHIPSTRNFFALYLLCISFFLKYHVISNFFLNIS